MMAAISSLLSRPREAIYDCHEVVLRPRVLARAVNGIVTTGFGVKDTPNGAGGPDLLQGIPRPAAGDSGQ
jgi:hypothetical protein